MAKTKRINPWISVVWLSVPLILLTGWYHTIATPVTFVFQEAAVKGVTHTGMILVGLSLVLGPLGKFFDVFDQYLHFRKQLGIIGFLYVLLHGQLATVLYVWGSPELLQAQLTSIVAGFVSLVLFFVCMQISEIWAIKLLGKRWRPTLRYLSYSAFILGIVHIGFIEWEGWAEYALDPDRFLPPLSLVTTTFGIAVVTWRLAVLVYDILQNVADKKAD